jgi:valyl-tRNA synthetase
VSTTRPETILGDTAVAVHPDDERYQHLVGKTALVPMLNREIPVIADAYVDKAFGTGALKVTPGHDPNDYEIARRHNLPMINIMNNDGTLNANAGPYAGLDRLHGAHASCGRICAPPGWWWASASTRIRSATASAATPWWSRCSASSGG